MGNLTTAHRAYTRAECLSLSLYDDGMALLASAFLYIPAPRIWSEIGPLVRSVLASLEGAHLGSRPILRVETSVDRGALYNGRFRFPLTLTLGGDWPADDAPGIYQVDSAVLDIHLVSELAAPRETRYQRLDDASAASIRHRLTSDSGAGRVFRPVLRNRTAVTL
jgi:hypothetical protein